MRLLEYLFFKYYHFQVKVGNEDIAPYTALLCLCLIIVVIYVDVLGFYLLFMPSGKNCSMPGIHTVIILFVSAFVLLFSLLIPKRKYKKILKEKEPIWKGKKNLGAILFAVLPIVMFYVQLVVSLNDS